MHRHPALLGAALLFWGWTSDYMLYAAAMASAIESAWLFKTRLDFSDRDFHRISDLSSVLLAGLTLYQFDEHGFQAIFPILEASPFVFFPLVLAQRFSTRDQVSYAALFLSVRRAVKRGRMRQVGQADVAFPYFVLCLLAASAGRSAGASFFPFLLALTGWALWRNRPPGRAAAAWVCAAGLPVALAYGAQHGMIEVRRSLEPLVIQMFQERLWARRDPYRAQTAIGHIGRLKVSQRIVARVHPGPGQHVPTRLRQAVYQTYSRQLWLAGSSKFEAIDPLGGGSVWLFGAAENALDRLESAAVPPVPSSRSGDGMRIHISSSLVRGRGMLILPNGTERVSGLNVEELERNPLGSTKVRRGPDLIEYDATFGAPETFVNPPFAGDLDLALPKTEREFFGALARELGLPGLPPAEVVARVREYFRDGFTYSLGPHSGFGGEPLHEFLTHSRSGHCEYYATATVLLLRAAGVPARYVSGYAVGEWSPLERAFVIRRRHAHSWATVHLDGAWEDVDTTPAVWAEREAEHQPWWLETYDLLAWLRFRFNRWRYDDSDVIEAPTLIALALGFSVLLAWRLARTTRLVEPSGPSTVPALWPGIDSELYTIEARLSAAFGPRTPGETPRAWVARLAREQGPIPGERLLVEEILPRHYRYRFDPEGLARSERHMLARLSRRWLEEHAPALPQPAAR